MQANRATNDDAPTPPSSPPPLPPQPPAAPPSPAPRWLQMPTLNMSLPVGATQLALADFDADGLIDIIFAAPAEAVGANATVHVWYAQLKTAAEAAADADAPLNASCLPPLRGRAPKLCTVPPGTTLSFFRRAFSLPQGWDLGDGGQEGARSVGLPARPPTLPRVRPPAYLRAGMHACPPACLAH